MTLQVICWKWFDPEGRWNSLYSVTAEHVNKLKSMLARHLHMPYDFCCVTDEPDGINDDVRIIDLPIEYRNKRCYVRLQAFSPWAKEVIGERFLSLDLDVVITGDITELVDRDEDFVAWEDWNQPLTPYCGSMWLHQAGTRTHVWDKFDIEKSPYETHQLRMIGSDQAWMGLCMPGEPTWPHEGLVRSYRQQVSELSEDTRIVFFHGPFDPSMERCQADSPWIEEHWR